MRRARDRLARCRGSGRRCRDLRRHTTRIGERDVGVGVAPRTRGRIARAFPGARARILLGTDRHAYPAGLRGGASPLWSLEQLSGAANPGCRRLSSRRLAAPESAAASKIACPTRGFHRHMPARPSALFFAPEAPYPLAGGGALRSASLLEYLAHRYEVDVIVFRQPGAPDPAGLIPARLARRITVLDLPANRRSLAARALRNAGRVVRRVPPLVDRFAGFSAAVAGALGGARYDLGVIEHSWCAPYLEQLSSVCTRTVLDLHNVESVLHARCAATEGRASATAHRVFQRRFGGTGAHLAAALFAGARLLADRCRTCPRHRAPSYGRGLPQRTAANATAARRRPRSPSSSPATWSTIPTSPPCASSGWKSGRGCATAGRGWCGGWWERTPPPCERYTRGDSRIEVVGPVPDAVFELAAIARRGSTIAFRKRYAPENSGGLGCRVAGSFYHIGRRGTARAVTGRISWLPTARSLSPLR